MKSLFVGVCWVATWWVVSFCLVPLARAQPPVDTLRLKALLDEMNSLMEARQCAALPPLVIEAEQLGERLGGKWRERALDSRRLYVRCYQSAGEYAKALGIAQRHVERMEQQLPGTEALMDAYNELGTTYFHMSRYEEARKIYERGLALARSLFGDTSIAVARFSNNIGLTWGGERAIPWYKRAVRILYQVGDTSSMDAVVFSFNLANSWYHSGDLRKAVEGFRRSLRMIEALPQAPLGSIALIKNNLSVALQNLGQRREARQLLLETGALYEQAFGPDHPNTAYRYSNLGLFFFEEGDYSRALQYFFRALAIRRAKMGDRHELVGNLYNNIGNCYRGLKRYQDALDYCEKALEIRRAVLGTEHREVADSYADIGNIYQELGLYERALEYYRKALDIDTRALGPQHPFLSDAWFLLGSCLLDMQRTEEARAAFLQSLRILQQNYLPGHPEIARTKGKLGLCFVDEPVQARYWFDEALDELSFAAEAANHPDRIFHDPLVLLQILQDKALFLKGQYVVTCDEAMLREALAVFEQAIATVEQVRMQYLEPHSRQALLARFFEIYEGAIDAALALYEQSRDPAWLQRAFSFSEKSKNTLLQEAIREHAAFRFAGIPEALLAEERHLQQELALLEKRRFVEYEKGKKARSAFIDTLDSRIFELKEAYYELLDSLKTHYPHYYALKYARKSARLEEVKRRLGPDEALVAYFVGTNLLVSFVVTRDTVWHVRQPLDFPLASWIEELRQSIRNYHPLAADRTYYVQKYAYLATELNRRLWQPLHPERLPQVVHIIPDGVIANLPFAALLDSFPHTLEDFRRFPYLLRRRVFSYNYSIELMESLATDAPSNRRMAAFAPDFHDFTDSAHLFVPLRHNIKEAEAVARIWKGDLFVGGEATLARFLAEAPSHGIIHLATHGQANGYRGEYSYLAFQPTAADTNELTWLLYVRDLYHLRLPAALVVLSACETSIGEYQRGEGVVSLARGFFYAGARSLITTLWTIDDRSSARLVQRFYELLAEGMSKDRALREACLEALDAPSAQKAHPLYWAAFVPVGNMEALAPASWWARGGWLVCCVALVIGGVAWWYYRRSRSSL